MGVVSLNLPKIYMKSKKNGTEFFDEIDYYMKLVRSISNKTRDFLSKLKASSNPLVFTQGGFDGGTLNPDDTIESLVKYASISVGYLGLHEVTKMHLGKSLSEDQSFALETMKHINEIIAEIKKEDHLNILLYGTPAESLASLACDAFVKEFGKVKGITDNGFFTNSFHLHVSDDVTPIEKITIESQFFPHSLGGHISHCRIPSIAPEMHQGMKDIIRYAMSLGLYQSINHQANYCCTCGSHWQGSDDLPYEENYTCPDCGSTDTVGIRRMNKENLFIF